MATKDEQLKEVLSGAGYDSARSIKPGFAGEEGSYALRSPSGVAYDGTGYALGSEAPKKVAEAQKAGDTQTYRIGDYTATPTGYSVIQGRIHPRR